MFRCGNVGKMVRPIPKISVWVTMFLRLKNITISYRVTGQNVNRDGSYGLKNPCGYLLEGDTRAVDMLSAQLSRFATLFGVVE